MSGYGNNQHYGGNDNGQQGRPEFQLNTQQQSYESASYPQQQQQQQQQQQYDQQQYNQQYEPQQQHYEHQQQYEPQYDAQHSPNGFDEHEPVRTISNEQYNTHERAMAMKKSKIFANLDDQSAPSSGRQHGAREPSAAYYKNIRSDIFSTGPAYQDPKGHHGKRTTSSNQRGKSHIFDAPTENRQQPHSRYEHNINMKPSDVLHAKPGQMKQQKQASERAISNNSSDILNAHEGGQPRTGHRQRVMTQAASRNYSSHLFDDTPARSKGKKIYATNVARTDHISHGNVADEHLRRHGKRMHAQAHNGHNILRPDTLTNTVETRGKKTYSGRRQTNSGNLHEWDTSPRKREVKQPQWRQRIIEEEQKRYKLQQKAKQMKSPALAKDYSMSSSQLARANHDALQDFLKTNYDKEFRNAAEIKAKMQGQSFQIAHHDKPSAADEFHRAQANNNHGYAQVGNSQDSLAYGERRRNAAEMRSRIKGKMLEGNIQGFF